MLLALRIVYLCVVLEAGLVCQHLPASFVESFPLANAEGLNGMH